MNYTAIEQKIIDLLSDGLPHDRYELLELLYGSTTNKRLQTSNLSALAVAILRLRPKVRALDQEIVTEHRRGGIHYRHVILLPGTNLMEDSLS